MFPNNPPKAKFRKFNGMWSRGAASNCPPDHLTDCYNCIFPGDGQVAIRENFTVQNDFTSLGRAILSYKVASLASGAVLLTLDNSGVLRNETAGTILATQAGADDFDCLCIFGRAYITFKQYGRGFGPSTFWYNGTTWAQTGWSVPGAGVTLTQPNAGVVDAGVHQVYVSFISPTGYISQPSPVASITSDGAHTISISAIPTGPAGTTGRILFMTPANQTATFFIPGGTIGNNTTTTFEYTGNDSALIASSDYLFDILSVLPACAALKFYNGRMVLIGRTTFPDSILVSNVSDPETINLVNNVVTLPVDQGVNTATGGLIIRKVLYITKPNSTYIVQDNGGQPGTWFVDIADSGLGAYDVGISNFASSMSAQDTLDSALVVNKRGLLFFNGTYSDPPLTYKIESIWMRMFSDTFYKCQIAHDVWNKRVYIAAPLSYGSHGADLTATTTNNVLLMMDYTEGLTPQAVKWSVWTSAFTPFNKIAVENFTLAYTGLSMIYQLCFATGGAVLYKLNPPNTIFPGAPDTGASGAKTNIDQYIITAAAGDTGVSVFTLIQMIFGGALAFQPGGWGTCKIKLYYANKLGSVTTITGFLLNNYISGIQLQRGINFTAERMHVEIAADTSMPSGNQGYFWLNGLDIYGNTMFLVRPSLVENL